MKTMIVILCATGMEPDTEIIMASINAGYTCGTVAKGTLKVLESNFNFHF